MKGKIPGSPASPEVSRVRVALCLPCSPALWRVFLAHPSEFRRFPITGVFSIEKEERAVMATDHRVDNMGHYRAHHKRLAVAFNGFPLVAARCTCPWMQASPWPGRRRWKGRAR